MVLLLVIMPVGPKNVVDSIPGTVLLKKTPLLQKSLPVNIASVVLLPIDPELGVVHGQATPRGEFKSAGNENDGSGGGYHRQLVALGRSRRW